MPKRQSPDWPNWLRAMTAGRGASRGVGVDDRRSQPAVDLRVGLGHVEEAKDLLAVEPGHLEGALDEVPVVVPLQKRHGGLTCLGHAGDDVHREGLIRRQREGAPDGHDGVEHGALRVGQVCGTAGLLEGRGMDRGPSPAEEAGAIGLVRRVEAHHARCGQHMDHPRCLLVGRAGPPPAKDGPLLGQYLGLHEQIAERAMGEIGLQRRHDDLRVGGHLDLACASERLVRVTRRISTSSSGETQISVCVSIAWSSLRNSARPWTKTAS